MKMNIPPYSGNESYIFFSYCHKDEERVYPIIGNLMKQGFRIWYDDGIDPGTEWPEVIAEHLEKSAACVAFVSEMSLLSHNCRKEINFAILKGRPLLIVMLDDAQLSPGLEMQLSTVQSVLAYKNGVDITAEIEKFPDALCCKGKVEKEEYLYLIRQKSGQPVILYNGLVIGRAEDCGYPLTGSDNVSSHHGTITKENEKLLITDNGSTNGTFLNGRKLTPHCAEQLSVNDVLRFADEEFIVKKGKGGEGRFSVELLRKGERAVMENSSFTVGSKKELCDMCVTDNNLISKKHFTIRKKDDRLTVVDNNSTNGSFVNGERLNGEEKEICGNTVIKAADELFFVGVIPEETED